MPLGDFVIEAVEAVTEFGGPGVNRPRFEAALLGMVGTGGGTALVEGVVTAFNESTFLAAVDTEVDGEPVSATDVPYLGVAVLDEGDAVFVAVLRAPTDEEDGVYLVLGATGPKSSADIICVAPGGP